MNTTTPADPPQQHALYRFYDTHGQLLYVGITNDPPRRLTQHRNTKDWWTQVAGVTIEWHPDRASVLAAERRAITVENPRHNVQLRDSLAPKRTTTASVSAAAVTLVWTCATCAQPIADGTGYLHVNLSAVGLIERETLAWQATHRDRSPSVDDLLEIPDPAPWLTHHRDCDPAPNDVDYWIPVERARTHADLLARTAHLMGKSWLEHTDWDELIDAKAAVRP